MQFFFEILSAASYRSVMLTLRYRQKGQLVLKFLDCETQFYAKKQVQVSNQFLNRIVSLRLVRP